VTELLPREKLDAIVQRTRDGGIEIVNLLKTSAWYAPASSVVEMVDAVLRDKKKVLPCAAYLQGEYGMRDVYLGVPVKLGRNGVEGIVEIALLPEEKAALEKSAAAVRELFKILKV
jgi:malate dehydrogenase